MADDSYANKSRWRARLPRKVRISNEKIGKWIQPTIHSTAEPPSLAEVEIHPILCPDAKIATCIPHISFPPPGRLLVGEVEGSIEGMCVWGGGGIAFPP